MAGHTIYGVKFLEFQLDFVGGSDAIWKLGPLGHRNWGRVTGLSEPL
jgi:hypothetical protein